MGNGHLCIRRQQNESDTDENDDDLQQHNVVHPMASFQFRRPWLQPAVSHLDHRTLQVLGLLQSTYNPKLINSQSNNLWSPEQLDRELGDLLDFKEATSVEFVAKFLPGRDQRTIEQFIKAAKQHEARNGRANLATAVGNWLKLASNEAKTISEALVMHFDAECNMDRQQQIINDRLPFTRQALDKCADFYRENGFVLAMEGAVRCRLQLEPEDMKIASYWYKALKEADDYDDNLLKLCDGLLKRLKSIKSSPMQLFAQRKQMYMARIVQESCAIEGNTMSPEEAQRAIRHFDSTEKSPIIAGKSLEQHKEIWGLWKAIGAIEKESLPNFTLQTILSLHENILLDDEEAGKLRQFGVLITNCPFVPLGHKRVESELAKLLSFIRNNEREVKSPIELAAIVHFAFVYIHPFGDGNGRLARLLMNICLHSYGYPVLIIAKADTHAYMSGLHMACMGDLRPFIRFIAHQMRRTLMAFIVECEFTCAHIDQPSRFTKSSEAAALLDDASTSNE